MLFLVATLLVLGMMVGAAAQLPLFVSLVAGSVIALWLCAFAVSERRRGRGTGR